MRSGDEMYEVTNGTNCEGLTPKQAYWLDSRVIGAIEVALEMDVDYERFTELIEAAWDTACCQMENRRDREI